MVRSVAAGTVSPVRGRRVPGGRAPRAHVRPTGTAGALSADATIGLIGTLVTMLLTEKFRTTVDALLDHLHADTETSAASTATGRTS